MKTVQTLCLVIITVVVLGFAYIKWQEHKAAEAGKDEPIACIVGLSNNCKDTGDLP